MQNNGDDKYMHFLQKYVGQAKFYYIWSDIDFPLNVIQWNRRDIDFPTSWFETGTENFGPYSPKNNDGIFRLGTEDKC